MRSTWMNSLLAATAAAALVGSITIASAQGPGGGDMEGRGGGQRMHQGPAGGGSGGGRAGGGFSGHGNTQSMGMQSRPGGHVGGFHQPRGPTFGGHALHSERGHAFHEQRSMHGENLGTRGRTGIQTGALHAQRGQAFREQRGHRGQALAERRRIHGQQHLTTASRTGTQTGVMHGQRGTRGFGQAGAQGRVSLSSQQRMQIHNVVLHRGFVSRFRVTNVNFGIHVGVRVPRSFHLFVVPEDVVVIAPRFRGFRCFVYEDELVIVDPFTFEIIAIILV